jgi:heptosyltransferase-2
LLRWREARPPAHLALLTHEKLADLWRGHPAIDRVMSFAPSEGVWSVAGRLRAERFDTGLALPNSHRSALELRLAGIPRRIGAAGPFRQLLLTQLIDPRPGVVRMRKRPVAEIRRRVEGGVSDSAIPAASHHIHHYLHLVAALGANPEPVAPRIAVADSEIVDARRKFGLHADRVWIGLYAGAQYGPAKRWPVERFIAAAREIEKQRNCAWLIFGGENDSAIAARIESALRHPAAAIENLAGRTTLREMCVALSVCRVLVTNDSGPMHVAAAVGTPVVAIFGSTSPELTGPGLPGDPRHRIVRASVPCSPCFLRECPIDFRCMNGITPDSVAAAVLEVLA